MSPYNNNNSINNVYSYSLFIITVQRYNLVEELFTHSVLVVIIVSVLSMIYHHTICEHNQNKLQIEFYSIQYYYLWIIKKYCRICSDRMIKDVNWIEWIWFEMFTYFYCQ